MFKKLLLGLVTAVIAVSCGAKSEDKPVENQKLIIGVSPVPHQELVELVKDDLKAEGVDLEIVVFNDYVQPNLQLKDKSIDANFFQHIPYMNEFGKENNIEMVSVGAIHVEPLKGYSATIKSKEELKDGDEVLIPNDPTNRGRALILLDAEGIIKLKDKTKLDSDISDIVENPKNLKLTAINTNNALAGGITKDKVVFVEGKDSPYANIITVLKGNENDERVKKLVKALQSDKVKKFIEEKYDGEVVPAF